MLEVIDVVSGMMLANVSSPRPVFMITGLNPGRDLRLMVFAMNTNGRSKPTVLEGFTTKVAQLQVGKSVVLILKSSIYIWHVWSQNWINRTP